MFFGQEKIWKQLDYLIPAMQGGQNLNILIRAPSGCGKTKLAFIIAMRIDENNLDYSSCDIDGNVSPDWNKRIIILDEVHLIKNPEFLYPYMDMGDKIIILCSNESGELKEPLTNRCIDLNFETYSDLEIGAVVREDFRNLNLEVPYEVIMEIVRNCNSTPRVARRIVERLGIIFRVNGIPQNAEQVRNILRDVLQIEDGLNPLHRRYLEYLEKIERGSLDLIRFGTRIDKSTILKEIEPVLIGRNLIKITSRGRQIVK